MSNRVVETLYRLRDGTTKVLRRIGQGYQKNAATAESSSTRIETAHRRQQSSIGGVLAKIGRMRFAYFAVAGAVAGVVRSIGGFVRAASDQENAEARLETALRNGRGATEDQLDSLKDLASERQRVTRFADEQTISAQAQLATFRLTADQIATLTPRVQDLAEGTRRLGRDNVDLEQSATLVGKALSGNAGELSRYGVVLTDAQREAIRFGDENERVAAIAEALDDNFKGLSTSLTPYEQAARSSENAMGDFREQLGAFITQSSAVTDALDSISTGFEGLSERVKESGGTIDRVLGATVAALRVLGNTAKGIFQAVGAGANRMQRMVLAASLAVVQQLQRVTFGSAREALQKWIDETDQQLGELEKKQEDRMRRLGETTAGFIEAGRDLNQALFEQTEAQEEANQASREAQEEALAQRRAEEAKREAMERTRETLKALGIDAAEVETGISTAARETIAQLEQLATDGQASMAVLAKAAREATKEFSESEIEAYRIEMEQLAESGEITEDQLAALVTHLGAMDDAAGDTASSFDRLSAAIEQAGSQHQLGNLAAEVERLGQAGELSAAKVAGLLDRIREQRSEVSKTSSAVDDGTESTQRAQEATEAYSESVEEASGRQVRFGGTIELTADAQEHLNEQINNFNGITASSFASHYRRSLDQALEITRKQRIEEERLQRLRDAGIPTLDNLTESNKQLRFELMELRGEQEKAAELKEQEERAELLKQIQEAGQAGDIEHRQLLRERLKLMDELSREREKQAKEAEREADAREREERASGGERDTVKRSGPSAGGRRQIEVTIKAEGGQPGGPGMSEADLAKLRQGLTREVLDEIRRDQQRGL